MKKQIVLTNAEQLKSAAGEAPLEITQAKRSGWRHTRWAILCLVLVSWITAEVGKNFDDEMSKFIPETLTNTSTYNKKPSGYSGLFELCQALKFKPKQWKRPYRELTEKGTLVIVGPSYPPRDFEAEQILNWVSRGNRLVYLDYFSFKTGSRFLSRLGLSAYDSVSISNSKLSPDKKLEFTEHVDSLSVSAETRFKPVVSAEKTEGGAQKQLVIAKDDFGRLVVDVRVGKGHCLVGTTPNICCNRRIAEPESKGNFQLLANWLQDEKGQLYFDEKAQGYSETVSFFMWLSKGPLGVFFYQIGLIFVVALVSLNQRFGPARLMSDLRRISNLEFVDGMAHTYRKARANDTAWSILFSSFRTRLCKSLGASPADSPETLALAWSEATGINQAECQDFLQRAVKAESTHITKEEMLQLVATCDDLGDRSKNFLTLGSSRRQGA
jgi:hypothetical protein